MRLLCLFLSSAGSVQCSWYVCQLLTQMSFLSRFLYTTTTYRNSRTKVFMMRCKVTVNCHFYNLGFPTKCQKFHTDDVLRY